MNDIFQALPLFFVVHRPDERRFSGSLTLFCRSSTG
jgi:hypothetical protein